MLQHPSIFQILAENSPEGISISRPDGILIYANRAFYDLHGYDYTSDEMLGMSYGYYNSSEIDIFVYVIIEVLQMGKIFQGESIHKHKNGQTFSALFISFPLPDEEGQPSLIASIIRDICQRSPLENPENTALLALNQELTEEIAVRKGIQAELLVFQQFTERSNDAIMILNQKGYVYYANSAAYALYGYDEQSYEMLSLPYSTYINYPSCESALRLALADIKGKRSFKTSLSCQRKDGSVFLGTVTLFALDVQAQKIALIIQDITKQYEAEQVLARLLRERIVLKQRIKALIIARQRRSKRAFLKIT